MREQGPWSPAEPLSQPPSPPRRAAEHVSSRTGHLPIMSALPLLIPTGALFTILLLSNASILPPTLVHFLTPSLTLCAGFALASSAAARRARFSAPLACLALALLCALPLRPGAPPPLPLPLLLPSLLVASAALPTVLLVLPSQKSHVAAAYVVAFLFSCGQSLYLSSRALNASAASSTSTVTRPPVSLFDVAVFLPFHVSLPAFIMGLLLARFLWSADSTDSSRSSTLPAVPSPLGLIFAAACGVGLLLCLRPSFVSYSAHFALVPLSLAIAAIAEIVTACPLAVGPVQCSLFDEQIVESVALVGLSAYALQNPVWRLLTKIACPDWCSVAPAHWLGAPRPANVGALGAAAGSSSMRPLFAILLPTLVLVSILTAHGVLRPAMRMFTLLRRISRHSRDGMSVLPSWANFGGSPQVGKPCVEVTGDSSRYIRKELGAWERAIRAALFFVGMFTFMATVWQLSWPIATILSEHTRSGPSLACRILPTIVYDCSPLRVSASAQVDRATDFALKVADSKPRPFTLAGFIVDVFRWTSILCLPAMVFNVLGHIFYPMPLWRGLPSVQHLFAADKKACTNRPPRETQAVGTEKADPATDVDMDFMLYVRYVTRGNNPRLIARNARDAALVLRTAGVPLNRFVVEVVTDSPLGMCVQVGDAKISEIVVPAGYQTPNGALFKARALHYAIGKSPARDFDWIVHLDEETRFDVESVAAIMLHCGRQNHAVRVAKTERWPRIGQGPIMYGRSMIPNRLGVLDVLRVDDDGDDIDDERCSFGSDSDANAGGNWITTLADSTRVSDDLGRYRTQFELGEVWVGMHGSFVVVANCVERLVTFDHGVEGSIAEDAYFAMLARANSVRFSWIDAFMYEQSPFTVLDFVKQRARWLVGGFKVCGSKKIPFRVRAGMGSLTGLWALMPFTYVSLMLSIVLGHVDSSATDGSSWYFHFMLPLMASISLWGYLYGFLATFSVRDFGIFRYATLLYMQLSLTPLFGLMEVWSVTYALLNFSKLARGFHVVQKEDGCAVSSSGSDCTVEESTPLLRSKADS